MNTVKTKVDGKWLNATHYTSLPNKEEAIKRMVADKNAKTPEIASKIYDQMVIDVRAAKDKEKQQEEAEATRKKAAESLKQQ